MDSSRPPAKSKALSVDTPKKKDLISKIFSAKYLIPFYWLVLILSLEEPIEFSEFACQHFIMLAYSLYWLYGNFLRESPRQEEQPVIPHETRPETIRNGKRRSRSRTQKVVNASESINATTGAAQAERSTEQSPEVRTETTKEYFGYMSGREKQERITSGSEFTRFTLPILAGTNRVDELRFLDEVLPYLRDNTISFADLIKDLGCSNPRKGFYGFLCYGAEYSIPALVTAFKRRVLHYKRKKADMADIYDECLTTIRHYPKIQTKQQYIGMFTMISKDHFYSMISARSVHSQVVGTASKFGMCLPGPTQCEDVQEYATRILPLATAN